jgi:hypothetical protein
VESKEAILRLFRLSSKETGEARLAGELLNSSAVE